MNIPINIVDINCEELCLEPEPPLLRDCDITLWNSIYLNLALFVDYTTIRPEE